MAELTTAEPVPAIMPINSTSLGLFLLQLSSLGQGVTLAGHLIIILHPLHVAHAAVSVILIHNNPAELGFRRRGEISCTDMSLSSLQPVYSGLLYNASASPTFKRLPTRVISFLHLVLLR